MASARRGGKAFEIGWREVAIRRPVDPGFVRVDVRDLINPGADHAMDTSPAWKPIDSDPDEIGAVAQGICSQPGKDIFFFAEGMGETALAEGRSGDDRGVVYAEENDFSGIGKRRDGSIGERVGQGQAEAKAKMDHGASQVRLPS